MWEIISSAVVLWILAKVNPGVIIKKKKKNSPELMLPWYIKLNNYAFPGGGGKKHERVFWSEYQKSQSGGYGIQLHVSVTAMS